MASYLNFGYGGSFAKLLGQYTNVNLYPANTSLTGAFVMGVHTTVKATRAIAFGLDGNTNVHDTPGMFKVFGDEHVTGNLTVDGEISADLSAMLDALDE